MLKNGIKVSSFLLLLKTQVPYKNNGLGPRAFAKTLFLQYSHINGFLTQKNWELVDIFQRINWSHFLAPTPPKQGIYQREIQYSISLLKSAGFHRISVGRYIKYKVFSQVKKNTNILESRVFLKKPSKQSNFVKHLCFWHLWLKLYWYYLKVHKRENFLGSDIEICTFS
jgi:hypothetical protein